LPSASRRTFSGFRSPWIMPAACRAARPPASCRPTDRTSGSGSGPVSCSTSRRLRPGTKFMRRNGPRASTPACRTCTTLGCSSARPAIASASKVAIAAGSDARCGWSVLTATSNPAGQGPKVSVNVPWNTRPVAPAPSSRSMRKRGSRRATWPANLASLACGDKPAAATRRLSASRPRSREPSRARPWRLRARPGSRPR